ncbi:MAG: hypothetical protein MI919_41825, partial [Holophagales bacterium]|nr:hypothetical protein [Holophagales bacterium]
ARIAALNAVLDDAGPLAVAVSGGVDSMTLATTAQLRLGPAAAMYHAVSPAVPAEATARVREQAATQGWNLAVIDAGEFADADYRRNPANRCFYCKSNLYGRIAAATDRTIASGTNLDDLGDFRPGLQAAKNHAVRHPFVEAGIDKTTVRVIARDFGLHGIAELPAAPCLSSRIETGIAIDADDLAFVHEIETLVRDALGPETVRCRVRRAGIVVELDPAALDRLPPALRRQVDTVAAARGPVEFTTYTRGSAFLRPAS